MIPVLICGPELPPKSLRSFVDASMLVPGQFPRIQNFRWDKGQLEARGGTALYLAAPVSGATLIDLIPCQLNGTSYLLGFFLKSAETRVYWSSQGSAWAELTEVGGFHGGTTGNTRFATNTGRFSVSVVKAPQGFFGGASMPSRDVALICNGADYNRVWDPSRTVFDTHTITGAANNGAGLIRLTVGSGYGRNTGDTVVVSGVLGTTEANGSWTVTRIDATHIDLQGSTFANAYVSGGSFTSNSRLAVHQPVTIPDDADVLRQKASFHRFWQVKASSGKTYYTSTPGPPRINDNSGADRFDFSDSTYDVYTGSNACIAWNWSDVVATGQIATVYFPNASLFLGKGLVLITEDTETTFTADTMLANVKIEVNVTNAAYDNAATIAAGWVTLYDPSSTNDKYRRYDVSTLVSEIDADLPRKQWFFPADHLSDAEKLIYHIRVTVLANAPSVTGTHQVIILAICGGGSFPGGTELTMTYEDEPGRSESRRFVPTDIVGAPLQEIGGPSTFASDQAVFNVAISTGTFYDFDLPVRNSDGADAIEGGLNGEPSRFNIYVRCPTEDGLEPQALYMYSVSMYASGIFGAPFVGLGWAKANTSTYTIHHKTSSVTDTYDIDWTARQVDRPAPSDFQISIPPAKATIAKNGRLIVGNVKDLAGQTQRSDGYFSRWRMPFRFESVDPTGNPTAGGRFTADGETIQAFVSSAAGSQGVSHIHVITDKWTYPLGGSGSQGGNPLDATVLGVLLPAISRGTNSPRSVCEKDGAIMFLDNTGQWVKLLDSAREISRLEVDDKPAAIPSARVDDVCGAIFKSRMYSTYAIAAGTTNTRIIGWNDLLGVWEFDDAPPVDVERICVYYDPSANGSGLKLLIGTQGGIVYEYESGVYDLATNPIAVRLTTWALSAKDDGTPIQIESVEIDADGQANTLTIDRLLGSPSGTYRTTLLLTNGWVTDSNKAHTTVVQVASLEDEWSRTVQLDIYGNMTSGTKIKKIIAQVAEGSTLMPAADGT